MRTEPELEAADALAAGHEALSRGEWEQALAYFEAASEQSPSAETIEARAMAAWWLDNARLAIESRKTHTTSTANVATPPQQRAWPSGSAGIHLLFAASPLWRAGCNGRAACSRDSTSSRNMVGSPSEKGNSPFSLRMTSRLRDVSPSEHGR
jgi:hypothetical protein